MMMMMMLVISAVRCITFIDGTKCRWPIQVQLLNTFIYIHRNYTPHRPRNKRESTNSTKPTDMSCSVIKYAIQIFCKRERSLRYGGFLAFFSNSNKPNIKKEKQFDWEHYVINFLLLLQDESILTSSISSIVQGDLHLIIDPQIEYGRRRSVNLNDL